MTDEYGTSIAELDRRIDQVESAHADALRLVTKLKALVPEDHPVPFAADEVSEGLKREIEDATWRRQRLVDQRDLQRYRGEAGVPA